MGQNTQKGDISEFDQLVDVIHDCRDRQELKQFMHAILTPQEQAEIARRLQIVKLLKKGLPQREIADKLKVGIATVTRGSHQLKKGNFKDITP